MIGQEPPVGAKLLWKARLLSENSCGFCCLSLFSPLLFVEVHVGGFTYSTMIFLYAPNTFRKLQTTEIKRGGQASPVSEGVADAGLSGG
jgi:hypothetical protein